MIYCQWKKFGGASTLHNDKFYGALRPTKNGGIDEGDSNLSMILHLMDHQDPMYMAELMNLNQLFMLLHPEN